MLRCSSSNSNASSSSHCTRSLLAHHVGEHNPGQLALFRTGGLKQIVRGRKQQTARVNRLAFEVRGLNLLKAGIGPETAHFGRPRGSAAKGELDARPTAFQPSTNSTARCMPADSTEPRRLRVASVQMESLPGDKKANFRKIESFVEKAAAQRVRLILFPECCVTGYWFIRNLTSDQLGALAEEVPDGPSTRRLVELAARHNVVVGAGLVEAAGEGVFHNSYVVALPDGTTHCHR